MIKKIVLAMAAGSLAFTAAACSTVKGAGKDLESASDATKDKINK